MHKAINNQVVSRSNLKFKEKKAKQIISMRLGRAGAIGAARMRARETRKEQELALKATKAVIKQKEREL